MVEQRNPKVWGSIPHGPLKKILFCPTLVKPSFSISLPSSKRTISLILLKIKLINLGYI